MKQSALLKTCQSLAKKATIGMTDILRRRLIPPINSTGIISHLNLTVIPTANGCVIESHFPNYAYFVEHGRRPGKQPPISSLTAWCARHGMSGFEYPLARKIAKYGTQGKHFLTPLNRMVDMLVKTMPRAVITDMNPHGWLTGIPKTVSI